MLTKCSLHSQGRIQDFSKGGSVFRFAHVVQQAVIISAQSALSRGVWEHAPPGISGLLRAYWFDGTELSVIPNMLKLTKGSFMLLV